MVSSDVLTEHINMLFGWINTCRASMEYIWCTFRCCHCVTRTLHDCEGPAVCSSLLWCMAHHDSEGHAVCGSLLWCMAHHVSEGHAVYGSLLWCTAHHISVGLAVCGALLWCSLTIFLLTGAGRFITETQVMAMHSMSFCGCTTSQTH